MGKIYREEDVLTAARKRVSFVFDHFEQVVVSFSGGKDSTVLLHLAREEARRRGRQVHAMFIDLESQYRVTIEHVEAVMLADPVVVPIWIALPLNLRNAVSVFQPHWCPWDPAERDIWVRELPEHEGVVSNPEALPWFRPRMEFEEFIVLYPKWAAEGRTYASLVGNCADESLHRYYSIKAVDKKCAWWHDGKRVQWSAQMTPKDTNVVTFFPIYDWTVSDIWTYHGDEGIRHNEIYDLMHLAGTPLTEQRICQPYGDDQRRGLDLWARVEPDTWEAVLNRVTGVNYGARYAGDQLLGYRRGVGLPPGHTWKSYTFLLLATLPDVLRERYLSNFAVFLEWWMRHGYPDIRQIHDDETETLKESTSRRLPSWRRLALTVLKNDFLGKSLSIGQVKHVWADVYDRVEAGEPVKVRKSVRPVYAYLRDEYEAYLRRGVEGTTVELAECRGSHIEAIKERYRDL